MDYQNMLARQGIGSAHPGGFAATIEFLSHFPFPRRGRILEIGCGTGRTACYLASKGYQVTAVDIRPEMLKKAQIRGEKERVHVEWVLGDACNLPFSAEQFEIIMAESVTVFTDAKLAMQEYYRVLRTGGQLYDREMMATTRHPKKVSQAIHKLYGVKQVPDLEGWLTLLRNSKFQEVGVWKPTIVPETPVMPEEWAYPDPLQQIDEDIFKDPQIRYLHERNTQLMTRYAKFLAYGVLLGQKK